MHTAFYYTLVMKHLMTLLFISQVAFAACPQSIESIESQALDFGFQNAVIDRSKETTSSFMTTKFKVASMKEFSGKCLVNLRLMRTFGTSQSFSDEFETIVYDSKFLKFEEAFEIPSKIFIGMGSDYGDETLSSKLYRVELTDRASIIAAVKSIVTGNSYHGFSGFVINTEKHLFDPETKRTWRTLNATYTLNRGQCAEVYDITAEQLDTDFNFYFTGGMRSQITVGGTTVEALGVTPWGDSLIRQFLSSDGQWIDVIVTSGERIRETLNFTEMPSFKN